MNIQVKTSNGITMVPLESKLMSERKVFIEGEINSQSAFEFVKEIMLLNSEDKEQPIDVLINTPGGEINAGMLIYDAIQGSKAPVRLFCMGRAYSMGAVILACGNHGRYILPHGEVMIHEPLLGNRVGGNSSSIKSISDNLLETKNKMVEILVKHTGKPKEEVEEAIGFDHYFSPEESVEFGLCDEITDFGSIMG